MIDTQVKDDELHIYKWGEETHAKFKLKSEGTHNIYEYNLNRVDTNKLRWLNLGGIDPIEVPIEYELSRHIEPGTIQISTYWSNKPALKSF